MNKEIVYNLLQHKYLEGLGMTNLSESEILKNRVFPDEWFSMEIELRVEIMTAALRNNLSLEEAMTKMEHNTLPPLLADYQTVFPQTNFEYFNSLSDEEKLKHVKLCNLYRKLLNGYVRDLGLRKYDDLIKTSNFNFIPISDDLKDYYQFYTGIDLEYYYLRNNIYIEKLSKEDLEYLTTRLSSNDVPNQADYDFIGKTFRQVIKENIEESTSPTLINFGPNSSSYYALNSALVIGLRYDEFNTNGMTDEQWDENNDKQRQLLQTISKQIEEDLSQKLDIPVKVIQYNEYSVKPLKENEIRGKTK